MPTIRELAAFRAVMETGSLSRAAEIMLVTQPAMSKIIKGLEEKTGLRLFKRHRQRFHPTVEAQILLNEVENVLHSLARVKRISQDLGAVALSDLTVSAMAAAGINLLPKVLADFQKLHPGSRSSLNIRSSPKLLELAIAQQFDVGFGLLHLDHHEVDCRHVMRLKAVVILPAGHRLEAADEVELADLRGEDFISLGSYDRTASIVDRAFEQAGIKRRVIAQVELGSAICEYVRQGAGVGIIDAFTAAGCSAQGLTQKPLSPPLFFDVYMLLPARRPASLVRERFLELLPEMLPRWVPEETCLLMDQALPTGE